MSLLSLLEMHSIRFIMENVKNYHGFSHINYFWMMFVHASWAQMDSRLAIHLFRFVRGLSSFYISLH
jgi:hypothetical protein